jgi:hypothetical protein
MLKTIAGNGVRTIIAETASRFARDLMVQPRSYAISGLSSWRLKARMPSWMMVPHPSSSARS